MTRARLLFAIPLLVLAACIYKPLPLAMAPVRAITLEAPVSDLTIAVLDFTDERPGFERGAHEFDQVDIGGRFLADDRFFSFHAPEPTLTADPAPPPDMRARVTGAAAFAWFPFPNPGVGEPVESNLVIGLPDYLALHLEQRGIFARVIRARDEAAARAAGASLFLTGRVDRFGAMLAEARDPYVVRPDDWIEFRRLAAVSYTVELRELDTAGALPPAEPPTEGNVGGDAASAPQALPLTRECTGRDEEITLFDKLNGYRGSQSRPLYQLDADRFPSFALEDMATGTRRALERATLPLITVIELAVTPPETAPAAPSAPSSP